ncbi:hypothetical protein B0T21DRAFT_352312 [Apiosordaria backusii]|uniref:Uncharacterized protein n=1 Tax=Apiosordaria backusii TaxID=314023 RepID=A0AA40DV68_9PEZI|nr:hypothetical protein B0T21DRAFT_352312 [Apiosordaria backusii]
MAHELLRGCTDRNQKHHANDGHEKDDADDDGREKDPRPQKRRRVGSLHCASRRSLPRSSSSTTSCSSSPSSKVSTRQKLCLLRRRPTSSALTTAPASKFLRTKLDDCKRLLHPSLPSTARYCPTMMTLFTPPPSPSPFPSSSRRAAQLSEQDLGETLPAGTQSCFLGKVPTKGSRPLALRKLLPKIGFDWAVCETRNRHARKVERRLAGLEGRERRAILRALSTSFSDAGGGKVLNKKGVERGLVEVFEGGLDLLRGEEMKMRGLEDQSLFWEEVIDMHPHTWFGQGGDITGEILHGLVLMAVEARLWDREHGVKIGWMNLARGRSGLVKVVDEFVKWLEENEDETVKNAYFGGIEGAVHIDFLGGKGDRQARDVLEMFRARYVVEAMDVDVDFEELLAEELGDLMARLAIDADEEMVDVDWEDWEWWWGEEGADEGIV